MATKLRMMGDRVLVKAIEAEQVSAGGIVIPDMAQEKPQKGTVLAVGPGVLRENGERAALDVKEGDACLYTRYGGTEITVAELRRQIPGDARLIYLSKCFWRFGPQTCPSLLTGCLREQHYCYAAFA